LNSVSCRIARFARCEAPIAPRVNPPSVCECLLSIIRSGNLSGTCVSPFFYYNEEIIIEALQEIIQGLQSLLHAAAAGPRILKPHRGSDCALALRAFTQLRDLDDIKLHEVHSITSIYGISRLCIPTGFPFLICFTESLSQALVTVSATRSPLSRSLGGSV
jgi:hypothetical protein